jgi:hypothetical protein
MHEHASFWFLQGKRDQTDALGGGAEATPPVLSEPPAALKFENKHPEMCHSWPAKIA